MTWEKRNLLIKDLSARLPYGVKICINEEIHYLDSIIYDDGYYVNFVGDNKEGYSLVYNEIKPYLFPLSSMTESQKEELNNNLISLELKALNDEISHSQVAEFEIDFYNRNHIDYRGLIPMGLALDATGLKVY